LREERERDIEREGEREREREREGGKRKTTTPERRDQYWLTITPLGVMGSHIALVH